MTPEGTSSEALATAPREKKLNRAAVRRYLAENPSIVLDDDDLGKQIVEAAQANLGSNVVDMQGAVMHRMRRRMRAIEIEREEMIDAATENMASMESIHDAVLTMLEAPTFSEFIEIVGARFGSLLDVDSVRLCLESELAEDGTPKQQGACWSLVRSTPTVSTMNRAANCSCSSVVRSAASCVAGSMGPAWRCEHSLAERRRKALGRTRGQTERIRLPRRA